MLVFRQHSSLRTRLDIYRSEGKTIGFVPTMGALHVGHAALVEHSKQICDITVCSIFVNPTQFNDPKDLEKYPRNEKADITLLEKINCDVLYVPEVIDVYPNGIHALTDFDLAPLDSILEGASRPGHFKGVANVVKRLLDIVDPDFLFLGQKDYQQVLVIKQLVALVDGKTKVVTNEIVREANGLAMSSRNERLDVQHRMEAGKIYEALRMIQSAYKQTSWNDTCQQAVELLNTIPDSKLDYLKLCDADTLQEIDIWNDSHQAVCLAAIYVASVRLIDNVLLE